jgi:hypothetical protein
VTVASGADRGGVSTKPHVIDFVGRVAALFGSRLTITTGTNHNERTTTGNISDHWAGNAADIAMTGASLTRLGQCALIAAGANPDWARRQTGGAYNVGGVQILFNTMIGGNHYNHLHVGLKGHVAKPKQNKTTVSPAVDPVDVFGGSGIEDVSSAGGGAKPRGASAAAASAIRAARIALDDEIGDARKLGNKTILAALQRLRNQLKKGITTEDLAQIRVSMRKYGKILGDQMDAAEKRAKAHAARIKAAAAAAAARAAEAISNARDAFQESWQRFASSALTAFDRTTQREMGRWQRRVSERMAAMRAEFQIQMRAFDAETSRGLAALGAPDETGEEAALRAFDEERSARERARADAERQRDLAAALAGGDPAEIARAQEAIMDAALDVQREALEEAARASRVAADASAEQRRAAYQAERDQLAEALSREQEVREQAYQDEQDVAMQNYQDQRDIQRDQLQLQLDDLAEHLIARETTWTEANKILAAVMAAGGANAGEAFTRNLRDQFALAGLDYGSFTSAINQAGAGIQGGETAAQRALRLRSEALNERYNLPKHALGGWTVPGADLGRDSVAALLRPGEYVQSAAERRMDLLTDTTGGGGATLIIENLHVSGTTDREVQRSLARAVAGASGRRIVLNTG